MQLAEYAVGDYDYNLAINFTDSAIASGKNIRYEKLLDIKETKANYLRENGKTFQIVEFDDCSSH